MQVGTLAIQHIFDKDVLYTVPLYQRPYVWTETEQWTPLWEDLRALAEAIAAGKTTRAHFMGASVQDLRPMPPGQIETRTIIDGQQRLTTLQLLLKAFHDCVADCQNDPYLRALDKLIRNNHPLSTSPHQQFKVWPTNADRNDFQAVMNCSDRSALLDSMGFSRSAKRTKRSIPDAYLYFHGVLKEWLSENSELTAGRIAGLYSAIRDNVRLVVIDLDDKDDAQVIFETLNARGTPLLSADLVKNSLLNEVQAATGNAQAACEQYWRKFDTDASFWRELVGRGHAQRARIDTFLQHALTLLTNSIVSASHLYSGYRDYARSDNAGTPIDRLKKFHEYGAIFKRLQGEHQNKRIHLFFERLRTLDVVTAWPFILALFRRYGSEEAVLLPVLIDIESFLLRRMVCRLSTRSYGEVFAALTSRLEDAGAEPAAVVRNSLLAGTAENDRWPSDDAFRTAWISNSLYENLSRPRLRMLLEAMEASVRTRFAETTDVPRNLTIEHIMPQSWREHWPLPPGTTKETRDRAVQTIGNLTLLNEKLNPSQSNKPWVDVLDPANEKRKALEAHTVLHLNKAICDFPNWDEERIMQRSKDLFVFAKRIWPHAQAGVE
jgi:uncharacterized protein with ParB-like and HNH nuclease domain